MGLSEDVRIFLPVEVSNKTSGPKHFCMHSLNCFIAYCGFSSCIFWLAYMMQLQLLMFCCCTLLFCLLLQQGTAPLSDLQCTTSSEALLCGKAPTFRLLVWAIDRSGAHVPHITYVVSESFVVATKRVKHAIKSDIPSIGDHISKLVHIGKATVDKLQDIKQAAAEESMDIDVPDRLNRVDKVSHQPVHACHMPRCNTLMLLLPPSQHLLHLS